MITTDDKLTQRLGDLLTEAEYHRWIVVPGKLDEGPSELHSALLGCRGALDRLEAIVAELTRLNGRAQAKVAELQASLDDAWNKRATDPRVGVTHGDSAPRERYAHYSAGTVEETIAVRRAERAARDVATTLDVCRLFHRGLDGHRRDLELRVRLLTFEHHLER